MCCVIRLRFLILFIIIVGFLLLYFSIICLRLDLVVYLRNRWLVVVELVKLIIVMFGWWFSGLLVLWLLLGIMLNILVGIFVWLVSLVMCRVVRLVLGVGLIIME